MENKFERIIENLGEEETLTLGDHIFYPNFILFYDQPSAEPKNMKEPTKRGRSF